MFNENFLLTSLYGRIILEKMQKTSAIQIISVTFLYKTKMNISAKGN